MDEIGENVQIFEEVLFFKLRITAYNIKAKAKKNKNKKKTSNQFNFLVSVRCSEAGGRKRARD